MKTYNKIFVAVFFLLIAVFAGCNFYMIFLDESAGGGQCRVEASRIARQIEQGGYESLDLTEYSTITAVHFLDTNDEKTFFESENDYLIRKIHGKLYRMEYNVYGNYIGRSIIVPVNISLLIMSVLIISVMLFIRQRILKPFDKLMNVPYELSKGNLTIPMKENKSKFFGRFIWGVNLLRENMEQQKKRELDLQKEKKTLVLSISHDIKTPLSAIKLYAKALSKGLYENRDRQVEIFENINAKADQIEGFVSEIIKASSEEFLSLEVNVSEFYLSQAVKKIADYYCEKLRLIKIGFSIEKYSDGILKGDFDRFIEVLQNVIENAIKYGDGHNIEILFSREEDCRLVTVRNSGCTLSDTELPHIFESFWRGSNTGNNSGSGLGLYICRQLIRKMDGDIFADINEGMMCVTVVVREV
ncbi:MAG: ATP-binding protein [Eubacterium sp.]